MQGMILAAGFGTRLKPLTDTMPKALVPLLGKPMLHHIIDKFISSGINEIIINAHYFSDQIEEFIETSDYKADIKVVKEETILGTGGGIFNMLPLVTEEDFFVYNTDVVCDVSLKELMKYHKQNGSLSTMVMQDRETFNQVIIDSENCLCGLNLVNKGIKKVVREPVEPSSLMAFCGIHTVNKRIIRYQENKTEYSIIDVYLNAVSGGEKITAFKPDIHWFDIGTIEKLRQAESFLLLPANQK
jgi:N-acetyl-alpha-D-muramate 1-phosphate uridylyltransferase